MKAEAGGKGILAVLFFVFFAAAGLARPVPEGVKTVDFPVDKVTVYQSSAYVERLGKVHLKPGENKMVLKGLPRMLLENTIMVYRAGNGGAYVIKEFEYKEVTEHVVLGVREKEIAEELLELNDEKKAKTDRILVLKDKVKFLRAISAKSTAEMSKQLMMKNINISKTEELLEFIMGGIEKSLKEQRKLERQLRKINDQIAVLNSELNGIKSSGTKRSKVLFINIETTEEETAKIGVKYVLRNVYWKPHYESNLVFEKERIETKMYAKVVQKSGDKWENVKLTIATGAPSFDATLPEPNPWILNEYAYRAYTKTKLKRSYAPAAAMEMGMEDKEEAYAPPQNRIEQVEVGELNMKMTVKGRYDIPSTGDEKKVFIKEFRFKADRLFYTAVPSKSKAAYLTAKFKNDEDVVLLPGQVLLYLDGSYTGRAKLGANINRGEEIKFSFGIDENIKIERTRLQSKKGESGLFGSDRKIDYAYKVKMKNHKDRQITIYIKEALPFSENDKIKVDFYEGMKYAKKGDRGIYTWKFKVGPDSKKELVYKFKVTYPKGMDVRGI